MPPIPADVTSILVTRPEKHATINYIPVLERDEVITPAGKAIELIRFTDPIMGSKSVYAGYDPDTNTIYYRPQEAQKDLYAIGYDNGYVIAVKRCLELVKNYIGVDSELYQAMLEEIEATEQESAAQHGNS